VGILSVPEWNMNELIAIQQGNINGGTVQTVNARELYSFLEVKSRFNDWITARVSTFGFIENQDFISLTENLVSGGTQKHYHLTLDMAKELSMVERNDKGKQARQYFIDCERQAKTLALNPANMTRIQLLEMAMQAEQERIQLEHKVVTLTPKAEALDRISTADGSLCITNAAKNLQIQPKILFNYLSSRKWIYRRSGGQGWVAYQDKLQQMLLEHKTTVVTRSDGTEKMTEQVLITAKGIARLAVVFSDTATKQAA
jgi:anti-repressor protein